MKNDLIVLDYLLAHSLAELKLEHGVNSRLSQDRSKISLNYDQINAKSGSLLVDQCRGLIIRPKEPLPELDWEQTTIGSCDVVARGMDRFYNSGDPNAASLDLSCSKIYEKLDGTMIMYYWDVIKHEWCAATRSVPEADIPLDDLHDYTFSKLFNEALHEVLNRNLGSGCDINTWHDQNLDKTNTYVFELTTPHNQVVIYYPKLEVTLLSRRCTKTGLELHVADDLLPGIKIPKRWHLQGSLQALINTIDSLDPKTLEGVVICGPNFERIKIKNKSYVLASKIKDTVCSSKRNVVEIIIRKKADDIIPILDDKTGMLVADYQSKISSLFREMDQLYDTAVRSTNDRKSFALFLQTSTTRWISGPIFSMFDKKVDSTSEYFEDLAVKNKLTPAAIDNILSLI